MRSLTFVFQFVLSYFSDLNLYNECQNVRPEPIFDPICSSTAVAVKDFSPACSVRPVRPEVERGVDININLAAVAV